jgi:hypothetical protein
LLLLYVVVVAVVVLLGSYLAMMFALLLEAIGPSTLASCVVSLQIVFGYNLTEMYLLTLFCCLLLKLLEDCAVI